MAPETSTLKTAMQVRGLSEPITPVGFEGERDTDVTKALGTIGNQDQNLMDQVKFTC